MSKRIYILLLTLTVLFSACEFKLKPNEEEGVSSTLQVQRYDRLESRYLTTGDFSALQQMNTAYPMQTRTLIEDMLELGEVNDPEIRSRNGIRQMSAIKFNNSFLIILRQISYRYGCRCPTSADHSVFFPAGHRHYCSQQLTVLRLRYPWATRFCIRPDRAP